MSVSVLINAKTVVGLGIAIALVILACKIKPEAANEVLVTAANSFNGLSFKD